MPNRVVAYHQGCQDGFGSAWAARKFFASTTGIEYIPCQYGNPLPDAVVEAGKSRPILDAIYMLDYSTDRDTTTGLVGTAARQVIIIDHHASAEKELAGLGGPSLHVVFDMAKSGAVLAWEYFHHDCDVPKLLLYVQDSDLWHWALPFSREISAFLASHFRSFENWDHFAQSMEYDEGFQEMAREGAAILRYQDQIVGSLASRAHPVKIGDDIVLGVNSACLQSEIGNRILEKNPQSRFAVVFFVTDQGDTVYSLRGRGDIDVGEIAKTMGGGGHRNASGFTVKRKGA